MRHRAPLPGIPEFFPKVPYDQATWTSPERKAWDCLKWHEYKLGVKPGNPIEITDRMGSQWCNAKFGGSRYGSTGRRCWQKGLQRLEARGVIIRTRAHGGRTIATLIEFWGPKPNFEPGIAPKGKAKRKAKGGSAPGTPTIPVATPEQLAAALAANRAVNADAPTSEDPDSDPMTPAELWAKTKADAQKAERAKDPRDGVAAEINRRISAAMNPPKCPDDPTRWRDHWISQIELIESIPEHRRPGVLRTELEGMKAWLADWDAPDDRSHPARE